MGTNELLNKREATHGSFALNACIAQTIKNAMRISTPNWAEVDAVKREALDMIALKISRICSGAYDFEDHWDDIIGYASLGRKSINRVAPDRV